MPDPDDDNDILTKALSRELKSGTPRANMKIIHKCVLFYCCWWSAIGISRFVSFVFAAKEASSNLNLFMQLHLCGLYTNTLNSLGRTVVSVKEYFH